jgi:hypothetical protein
VNEDEILGRDEHKGAAGIEHENKIDIAYAKHGVWGKRLPLSGHRL